jgi:uncharacterized RmlC-like cupin family protein
MLVHYSNLHYLHHVAHTKVKWHFQHQTAIYLPLRSGHLNPGFSLSEHAEVFIQNILSRFARLPRKPVRLDYNRRIESLLRIH